MDYKPLVTIIIPVYNGSDYVKTAIESALSQTYKNIEVLVINDGSKDDNKTRIAVEPYFNRVKYIEKENGGVSSVLNLAFETMNGEWLSWLSHDDIYYPDKIQKQIEFLNSIYISNYSHAVLFCDFDFIDEFGRSIKIPTKSPITSNMDTLQLILSNIKRNSFGGCTFLIPRNAFYNIGGFSENLRTISDYDYWYRLLFSGYDFYYIPMVLVSNRMHSQQVTYIKSDLAKKESEIFHKYVVEELVKSKVYCKEDIFMKIGYYMGCKGIDEASNLAYKYALLYKSNKYIRIRIFFQKIKAYIFNVLISILKKIYIKNFIFKGSVNIYV